MKRSTRINLTLAPVFVLMGLAAALWIARKPMVPLTAENLAQARTRWAAQGVADYDMRLRMQGGDYHVRCRDGLVDRIELNGVEVSSRDPAAYSVEGLHDILAMDLDAFAAGRTANVVLMRVEFDREQGFVRRYLRSGAGQPGQAAGGALIELIDFEPVSAAGPARP